MSATRCRCSGALKISIGPRYHWLTLQASEECCMADHIDGPLYYERMGRTGPVMAFMHPNPMDRRLWPENQAVSTVGSDDRLP